MRDRSPYTYVILRYRHDPAAGEQLNVGVALHCAGVRFLGARVVGKPVRLSRVFRPVDRAAFQQDMKTIEKAFSDMARTDAAGMLSVTFDIMQFARRAVADEDGYLTWSEMRSGVTADPAATLDALFDRFVTQNDEEADRGARDDAAIWRALRPGLADRQIADVLEPKTIRSPHDEVEFEHAWKNGAWRCLQPLSFDLTSAAGIRDKAERWAGRMVGLKAATEDFKPFFLVGRPHRPELEDDFRRAVGLLGDAPRDPKIVHEEQFEAFLDELEREMRAAGKLITEEVPEGPIEI